jgi:D-aminoacyl-tRNA deacylase
MRAVIQRVEYASVTIGGKLISSIKEGLLILIGIEDTDTMEDIEWLSAKISNLRIFNDELGVMNRSIKEVEGELLIVSQFTLFASTLRGNRPSYIRSAKPETALPLYKDFIKRMESHLGKDVQTGVFGAAMKVELLNDGPVTLLIDTKNKE